MTRRLPRREKLVLPLLAFCLAGTLACDRPITDIVATASDDVGPFEIANEHTTDATLTANLCIEQASEADTIIERVLFQLRNKGYQRIELDVVPTGGEGRRLAVWTPREGTQVNGVAAAGGENPCASGGAEAHE
jgi:hypothetical protein